MKQNNTILSTHNLTIGYRQGKKTMPVLEGLDIKLERAQLVCLIGPNGVGKSTLLRTLAGLQPALTGQVFLNEQEISSYKADEKARLISMVLTDKVQALNMRVTDLVAMGRYPYTGWTGQLQDADHAKVEEAIALTHTNYIANKKLYELSDGQLQKAMIARALAQDGELIMLDEPTAHLDISNALDIMQLLQKLVRETGKTMLVSTHSLDLSLEMADMLWLAQCGSPILTGLPEDMALSGAIEKLYPQEGIYFDLERGKFSLKKEPQDFDVQGPEPYRSWTVRALSRLMMDKPASIVILEENGKASWNYEGRQFDDIASLIKSIITKNPIV